MNIQQASVSGLFYPEDQDELSTTVKQLMSTASAQQNARPKALISPHAGYLYSGEIAASAFIQIAELTDKIKRIIVMAPSHRVAFRGIATSSADYFRTPLGDIKTDHQCVEKALNLPQVTTLDRAFQGEHALEVQLPFLQHLIPNFLLVPFIVGDADTESVSEVLELLWGQDDTLIVISSDLSHFHDYETAKAMDDKTSHAIVQLAPENIRYDDACGRNPIKGLLRSAQLHQLTASLLDQRNSGDTAGGKDRVVGYGAYLFQHQDEN